MQGLREELNQNIYDVQIYTDSQFCINALISQIEDDNLKSTMGRVNGNMQKLYNNMKTLNTNIEALDKITNENLENVKEYFKQVVSDQMQSMFGLAKNTKNSK